MNTRYNPPGQPALTLRAFQVHALVLVVAFFLLPDSSVALDKRLSQKKNRIELALKNVTLKEVLKEIERQTEYSFVINDSELPALNQRITILAKEEKIKTVMNMLLAGTGISFHINKKQITLIPPSDSTFLTALPSIYASENNLNIPMAARPGLTKVVYSSSINIKGKVTDNAGNVLPGVNISEKGTNNGAVTDGNGAYSINVQSGESILVFSFIGFKAQEVTVGTQTTIDITLAEDLATLSEVVVIGYGTQEKKDVTGSIATVKGSDIENLPSGGAQQSLQGRAAGVNIVRNGGAPGNAGSIRIRGLGTVNNADPLIVIDGIPAGTMNDVNPNDIQSIEVLKDASASAIYGTRAANGVILVTTKRGKFDDKIKVTLNAYTGVSENIKTIDVLDAPTLALLKRESYTNDNLAVPAIWTNTAYQTQKTNWQNEVLRQGTTNNLDFSIRGGGKYSSFAISGGDYREKGIIKNSYYNRYTFRINSDHLIGDRLKVGQNLQYTNTNDAAPNTLSAQNGLIWSAIRFHPGLPVIKDNGNYSTTLGVGGGAFGDINNPVYTIDTQDKNTARNRFLASVTGEFEIIKGLSVKANLAMDATFTDYKEFEVKVDSQYRQTNYNQLTVTNDKTWSFLQEYFLTYKKQIDNHSFGIVGGYTSQQFNDIYSKQQGRDFASEAPDLRYMALAQTVVNLGSDNGGRSYIALESWFGRANYSFKDRYLLTATVRSDGSSRFAEGHRWGVFPAFSLGWRISEEPFFQNILPTVSLLKLTGGWGQLGNQNVNPFQYLALLRSDARYAFGSGPTQNQTLGTYQSLIPNVNIGWETAQMSNIGLDFGFLQNSLTATVAYFIKDTKNMLLQPPSVGTLGRAAIPDQNVGQLRNQGLELELSYRKTVGDLSFSVGGNATFIQNTITQLLTSGSFLGSQPYGRLDQEITRTYVGTSYGTFYGWKTNGLYQNQGQIDSDPALANDSRRSNIRPGDVRFVDLNGDGLIDGKDRQIIGTPQPTVTYGFNGNVAYRGFDLNLFFVGVGGSDIYNADKMQGLNATYPYNMYQANQGRWTGEGTSNSIPHLSQNNPNNNYRTSDLFIEKGGFLRLKNVTLGYSLPKKLIGSTHITSARFYISAQNLFTFTSYSGLNPELGYADGNRSQGQYTQLNVDYAQYPLARTYTIGATISFQ